MLQIPVVTALQSGSEEDSDNESVSDQASSGDIPMRDRHS